MQRKYVLLLAGVLLALNVLCWQEVFVLSQPKYLMVDFLNVGQGDSAFIQTPENYHILVDGGPDSAVLEKLNNLLPFWDKTIDVVILSHPEKDHMAGILDVLQRYNVKYFLWTGVKKDNAENKKLAELLDNAQKQPSFLASLKNDTATKVVTVSAGDEIKLGNVLVDILFPFQNEEGKVLKGSANEDCVVNKITYGNESFLFTGDIDSKAEAQLVKTGGDRVSANVLKVGHHGSKYSSSDLFLQAVKPQYAVIEVGKNSYGHPTPEALQRLENFGIKVKRTDQNGDVKFLSDGNNITLEK